jgi:ABC-type transporter Mla MlaB component
VGLFSRFTKHRNKEAPPEPPPASTLRAPDDEAERLARQQRQREIARQTALKIDAIEAAMVSDIFNGPEPAWNAGPRRRPKPAPLGLHDDAQTTLLLADEELPTIAAAAQSAPVVEESAMLYANNQLELAEQQLLAGLREAGSDRTVWWMLFDLFQVSGQQERFDDLAIDYASKFETSPPAWVNPPPCAGAAQAYSGVTPTLAVTGPLDAASAPALERLQRLADDNPVLRLELSGVSGIDPAGCALLLQGLRALQARQCELIVVAAAELAAQIRATLRVGQRDATEAPWLLLLELLQLLNREKEFEETAMDYCVTFEVSPPSFVAPKKVATAARQYASPATDRFMLPAVVEGDCGALFEAIDAYAALSGAIVFDCSRLQRIEYRAAGLLHKRLTELAGADKKIEFRDLNHLVAALLRLLAFSDIARIFPQKY